MFFSPSCSGTFAPVCYYPIIYLNLATEFYDYLEFAYMIPDNTTEHQIWCSYLLHTDRNKHILLSQTKLDAGVST